MDFTRKIPGIRLPIPGRRDRAAQAVEPWPTGLVDAWVYTFLIVVPLGIFLLCTLNYDGSLGVLWLEPHVLGLTLFAIATTVNVLLILMVIGGLLLSGAWRSRLKWKRGLAYLVALGLLGGAQTYLNGWKGAAERTMSASLERQEETQHRIALIQEELRTLGPHLWAGEYSGRAFEGEFTCWFAPQAGFAYAWYGPEYSSTAHVASRLAQSQFQVGVIEAEESHVRVIGESRGRILREYEIAAWDGRRCLVAPRGTQRFAELVESGDPTETSLESGILLRKAAD